jgi:hypothetical protein
MLVFCILAFGMNVNNLEAVLMTIGRSFQANQLKESVVG